MGRGQGERAFTTLHQAYPEGEQVRQLVVSAFKLSLLGDLSNALVNVVNQAVELLGRCRVRHSSDELHKLIPIQTPIGIGIHLAQDGITELMGLIISPVEETLKSKNETINS